MQFKSAFFLLQYYGFVADMINMALDFRPPQQKRGRVPQLYKQVGEVYDICRIIG